MSVTAAKTTTIQKSPLILVLHLKRFEYLSTGPRKIKKQISFAERLSLPMETGQGIYSVFAGAAFLLCCIYIQLSCTMVTALSTVITRAILECLASGYILTMIK